MRRKTHHVPRNNNVRKQRIAHKKSLKQKKKKKVWQSKKPRCEHSPPWKKIPATRVNIRLAVKRVRIIQKAASPSSAKAHLSAKKKNRSEFTKGKNEDPKNAAFQTRSRKSNGERHVRTRKKVIKRTKRTLRSNPV